jgi:hypothetical protein
LIGALLDDFIADRAAFRMPLDRMCRAGVRQLDRTRSLESIAERLGDVRSKAVTQGKIADILQARGQLDEALRLHEARLPVALRLQDIDSLAHIRFCMAFIRLKRGDAAHAGLQQIYEELQESFEYSIKLGRPDFIGPVRALLAQVMRDAGRHAEQISAVLAHAEQAFVQLGDARGIARVRQLRDSG